MRQQLARSTGERAVARLAGNQHGVISSEQLNARGVESSAIKRRVTDGRLHRLHRGVYAVGHPSISNEGRWMAAVLAYGEGAVLSHRSAAALWGIGPVPHLAEVTIAGDAGRARRDGIRLHRSRTLSPADVTRRAGIPVTKPVRTLADLRRVLPDSEFARALRKSEYLKLPLGGTFELDHTAASSRRGSSASVAATAFPQPEVNVPVDRFVVDFLWRDARLIVEVDGWDSHRTRSAFEGDRARDARLKLLGYDVVRFGR